jgi:hypothetical protein
VRVFPLRRSDKNGSLYGKIRAGFSLFWPLDSAGEGAWDGKTATLAPAQHPAR